MIKSAIGLLVALTSSPALATSECAALKGCERKFCEIQHELDQAQAADNSHKAAGLSRSLTQAKANCTDESLISDLQDDLAESHEDMQEYQADLEEAQRDADAEKVAKYQSKIAEEKLDIERLERELSTFEQ
ncbi:MAG: DUF1090 domain-containing protein [Halopseudomonas sp.]|uniref:DUF1090 domain-containing protein n=1 Tax=Halopseudomonas sp. TaxID=2901191 RepID=UPI003001A050